MLNLEIAEAAKVSPATVSRVVNNRPGVSRKTVDRVLEVMCRNGVSRRKSPKREKNGLKLEYNSIGVLVLSDDIFQINSTISNRLINGIQEALREQNLNMLFSRVLSSDCLPPAVAEGKVDGLILMGACRDDSISNSIQSLPSVWLSSHHEKQGDVLLVGNDLIGEMAAKYLLNRGHKKMCVINAFSEHPGVVRRIDFFKYYAESTKSARVDVISASSKDVLGNDNDLVSYKKILKGLVGRLLELETMPTGLFVPVDMQVAMLYDILYSYNIIPGKDVEIIGTDNDAVALAGLHPKPATIDIGANALGYRAVQELMWKLGNPASVSHQVCVSVRPTLIFPEDVI